MRAIADQHPAWMPWTILEVGVAGLFTAILPIFLFALYQNETEIQVSKRYGRLALAAARMMGLAILWDLPKVIHVVSSGSWTIGRVLPLIEEIPNVFFLLLMIAICMQAGDGFVEPAPVADLLRLSTKVAVIAWGIWAGFNVLRLRGVAPPGFGGLVKRELPGILSQAALFVIPYVIYKSLPARVEQTELSVESGTI